MDSALLQAKLILPIPKAFGFINLKEISYAASDIQISAAYNAIFYFF